MHQAVDRGPLSMLVHPHAPEAGDPQITAPEQICDSTDLGGRHSRELFDVLGGVLGDERLVLIEGDRAPGQGRRIGRCPERAVALDELLVVVPVRDEEMRDAVRDRQVGVRAEDQVVLRMFRGAGATGGEVDDQHRFAAGTAVHHPREEHGMHLRGVVPPRDQHIALVEVVVATSRLVDPIGREESSDRGGHAQPRVRVEVVVPEPTLHEFLRGISLGDRPLPRAIVGEPLGSFVDPLCGDVDGALPGDRLELSIDPEERLGESILAVQGEPDVVPLHTEESFVHLGDGIPRDRDDPALSHPDLHVAAGPAEAARRLVPAHIVPGRKCWGGDRVSSEERASES